MWTPLAYLAMSRWLASFAHRTGIDWTMFVRTAALTVAVALLTVSWHTIRAPHLPTRWTRCGMNSLPHARRAHGMPCCVSPGGECAGLITHLEVTQC